jgi:hypothetical protein
MVKLVGIDIHSTKSEHKTQAKIVAFHRRMSAFSVGRDVLRMKFRLEKLSSGTVVEKLQVESLR